MPKPLRISPIALNPTNRKVLKVAVNLINGESTSCQLQLEDDVLADLLVIDGDSEAGQQILTEAHDEQVKLVISQQRQQGNNIIWQEAPVRVSDMRDLLSRIYRRMQTAMPAPEFEQRPTPKAAQQDHQPPADEEVFIVDKTAADTSTAEKIAAGSNIPAPPEAANATIVNTAETVAPESPAGSLHAEEAVNTPRAVSLFHILLNARQQKICRRITAGDYCIFVGGHDGTILTKGVQHTQAVLTAPAQHLQIEQIDIINFAERVQGLHISPLNNLIWQAGVDHCDGQLLTGHDMNRPVRLNAWPNFTRNGFRQSHFKLATIMARQPISLNALREESGVTENEIISFFNAAYAVGLIDETNIKSATSTKGAKQQTQRKGLFRKLANKFRRR